MQSLKVPTPDSRRSQRKRGKPSDKVVEPNLHDEQQTQQEKNSVKSKSYSHASYDGNPKRNPNSNTQTDTTLLGRDHQLLQHEQRSVGTTTSSSPTSGDFTTDRRKEKDKGQWRPALYACTPQKKGTCTGKNVEGKKAGRF